MQPFSSHETFNYEIDRAKLNFKNQGFNAYAGLKEGFEMMRYQNNRSSKVCAMAQVKLNEVKLGHISFSETVSIYHSWETLHPSTENKRTSKWNEKG